MAQAEHKLINFPIPNDIFTWLKASLHDDIESKHIYEQSFSWITYNKTLWTLMKRPHIVMKLSQLKL